MSALVDFRMDGGDTAYKYVDREGNVTWDRDPHKLKLVVTSFWIEKALFHSSDASTGRVRIIMGYPMASMYVFKHGLGNMCEAFDIGNAYLSIFEKPADMPDVQFKACLVEWALRLDAGKVENILAAAMNVKRYDLADAIVSAHF